MKKGILTKPKKNHEHDQTKFKLLVFYSQKITGEFYTQYEKDQNKNRKYHDSIDFILTKGGYITRHDVALQKLLNHLTKWGTHIERAILFMNDFANDKQYKIGKFEKDETKNIYIQPEFTHYQELRYNEKIFFDINEMQNFEIIQKEFTVNEVFATGLISKAIDEYNLKHSKSLIKY